MKNYCFFNRFKRQTVPTSLLINPAEFHRFIECLNEPFYFKFEAFHLNEKLKKYQLSV